MIVEWINYAWELLNSLALLSMMCSAFVASTPTPKADILWGKVYKWIDIFAINIGKAKERGR